MVVEEEEDWKGFLFALDLPGAFDEAFDPESCFGFEVIGGEDDQFREGGRSIGQRTFQEIDRLEEEHEIDSPREIKNVSKRQANE
jgi:hypothetical protein